MAKERKRKRKRKRERTCQVVRCVFCETERDVPVCQHFPHFVNLNVDYCPNVLPMVWCRQKEVNEWHWWMDEWISLTSVSLFLSHTHSPGQSIKQNDVVNSVDEFRREILRESWEDIAATGGRGSILRELRENVYKVRQQWEKTKKRERRMEMICTDILISLQISLRSGWTSEDFLKFYSKT